jgi:hypothetical protein
MKEVPQVGDWVFYCDRPYRIQKRFRKRRTNQITLLVCWCGELSCEHQKQEACLSDCSQYQPLLDDLEDCRHIIQSFPEEYAYQFQIWIQTVFSQYPEQKYHLWNQLTEAEREKVRRLVKAAPAVAIQAIS